ncbi:MAG: hypothetical protein J1F64_03740, partial [Oscillospiraceae bacterium]|nr:hypothetical protein [Oscillospiraceae bacterium]
MKRGNLCRIIASAAVFAVIVNLFPIIPSAADGLKVGDYVQFGRYSDEPIIWRCVSDDENGMLMITDEIISIKAFDAKGTVTDGSHGKGYYGGMYRQAYGSNYWGDSNIRTWLRSNKTERRVEYICGNPPSTVDNKKYAYEEEAGFAANFTTTEMKAVRTVCLKSILDAYEETPLTSNKNYHIYNDEIEEILTNYNSAYSEELEETFFLPDVKQIYDIYSNGGILGEDYYIGRLSKSAAGKISGKNEGDFYHSWLRSPRALKLNGYSYHVRYITLKGKATDKMAYESIGIRPAFYIDWSKVSLSGGSGSKDNPYITVMGEDDSPIKNPPPDPTEAPTPEPMESTGPDKTAGPSESTGPDKTAGPSES